LGVYSETIVRGAGGLKNWTSYGTELTIESVDGTRVTGTFRVIGPNASNPNEPPVTIEQGLSRRFCATSESELTAVPLGAAA
jgi:hypothetical protein